jgi:hypothetical protein
MAELIKYILINLFSFIFAFIAIKPIYKKLLPYLQISFNWAQELITNQNINSNIFTYSSRAIIVLIISTLIYLPFLIITRYIIKILYPRLLPTADPILKKQSYAWIVIFLLLSVIVNISHLFNSIASGSFV